MKLKRKQKEEKGVSTFAAILIGIVVILVIVILVSIISWAKGSINTLKEMQQKDADKSQGLMSSTGLK